MVAPIDWTTAESTSTPVPGSDIHSRVVQVVENAGAPTVNDDNSADYRPGYLWHDTTSGKWYKCDDDTTGAAVWSGLGAGATGGGGDEVFVENGQTVTEDYTLSADKNAHSVGPIDIATGKTVTVPTGARWVIS